MISSCVPIECSHGAVPRHGWAPLFKKQIPVRTFHGWDDAQPGFLEIDVMAHCGTLYEGSYPSTLTLTDSVLGLETILGAFVAGVILK